MDPLAPRIASVLSRLLTANTEPFSPTAGFCCSSAWSGTVNSPPANPSTSSAAQASGYEGIAKTSANAPSPMPNDPNGTRPSSTLSPDHRPAARLPPPTPTARHALIAAMAPSLRPMTWRPAASTAICSSAPRNQNHATPSAVIHSVRSLARRCTPAVRPAHGFHRSGTASRAGETRGMPTLTAAPTTATAVSARPMVGRRSSHNA